MYGCNDAAKAERLADVARGLRFGDIIQFTTGDPEVPSDHVEVTSLHVVLRVVEPNPGDVLVRTTRDWLHPEEIRPTGRRLNVLSRLWLRYRMR